MKEPQADRAVDTQHSANDSVLHFYRETIVFRKANAALTEGATTFLDAPDPDLAFTRKAQGQTLTCVFNLSNEALSLSLNHNAAIARPHHATVDGKTLHLPGNGHVYLAHDADLALSA